MITNWAHWPNSMSVVCNGDGSQCNVFHGSKRQIIEREGNLAAAYVMIMSVCPCGSISRFGSVHLPTDSASGSQEYQSSEQLQSDLHR